MTRRRAKSAFIYLWAAGAGLVAGASGEARGGEPFVADRLALVAKVEQGQVRLQQVLELWIPAREEALSLNRRDGLPAEACAAKLQAAWTQAVETAVREEAFYQEARREYERMLQQRIDAIYQSQNSRGGGQKPRAAIEREVRRILEKRINQQMEDMVAKFIKVSGGPEKLKRVIVSRGLTWEEWRDLIRRKAFSNAFLQMTLAARIEDQPRPAEVKEFFRTHREEFIRPGRVKFVQVFFSNDARGGEEAARAAAVNVYEAVVDGRLKIEDAARKHSDDPVGREHGGLEDSDHGLDREEWLNQVREAAAKLRPGELGPILVSDAGCHLVSLIEKEPDEPISFAAAQKEIAKKIQAAKWEQVVQDYYQSLRKTMQIEIVMPNYPRELAASAAAPAAPLPLPAEARTPAIPTGANPAAANQPAAPAAETPVPGIQP